MVLLDFGFGFGFLTLGLFLLAVWRGGEVISITVGCGWGEIGGGGSIGGGAGRISAGVWVLFVKMFPKGLS